MMGGAGETNWQDFVLAYGWGARATWLAAVVGRTSEDIGRLRGTGACTQQAVPKGFAELWTLYHGRPPADEDWPPPTKFSGPCGYEWLVPEIALLASLVGQMGIKEIARILTARLRHVTGDPAAQRGRQAVQMRINRIGLQTSDVLGGITIQTAAQDIGSLAMVQQAIQKGTLPARRVGRLWVISHDAWAHWKASRTFPPDGYVPLADFRERLGIRSDKLSEFARAGHVPTSVRCNPYGKHCRSTQFGTWFIDPEVGEALVTDRQAGRPLPWHGKGLPDNLRRTYQLWQDRRHPDDCPTCSQIWGDAGPPASFAAYCDRYPSLGLQAKRHLTKHWVPGMPIDDLAACSTPRARRRRVMAPVAAPALVDLTGWLSLGDAAADAGVSPSTIIHWADAGAVVRRRHEPWWLYWQDSIRVRARAYWETARVKRAPPLWLQAERAGVTLPLHPPPSPTRIRRIRNVPIGLSQSTAALGVEAAIAALSDRGHVVVALKAGRYLFDGIAACTAGELIARARG